MLHIPQPLIVTDPHEFRLELCRFNRGLWCSEVAWEVCIGTLQPPARVSSPMLVTGRGSDFAHDPARALDFIAPSIWNKGFLTDARKRDLRGVIEQFFQTSPQCFGAISAQACRFATDRVEYLRGVTDATHSERVVQAMEQPLGNVINFEGRIGKLLLGEAMPMSYHDGEKQFDEIAVPLVSIHRKTTTRLGWKTDFVCGTVICYGDPTGEKAILEKGWTPAMRPLFDEATQAVNAPHLSLIKLEPLDADARPRCRDVWSSIFATSLHPHTGNSLRLLTHISSFANALWQEPVLWAQFCEAGLLVSE